MTVVVVDKRILTETPSGFFVSSSRFRLCSSMCVDAECNNKDRLSCFFSFEWFSSETNVNNLRESEKRLSAMSFSLPRDGDSVRLMGLDMEDDCGCVKGIR